MRIQHLRPYSLLLYGLQLCNKIYITRDHRVKGSKVSGVGCVDCDYDSNKMIFGWKVMLEHVF